MTDFLDEQIAKRKKRNPDFPALFEAALERREVGRLLAEAREASGKTQVELAREIGTSQSQVARIETGNRDIKLSTLTRYAAAIGFELVIQPKRTTQPRRRRPVALSAPR
ncbi:MAG TPA: helix-turn-helix transcriptional regulator [Gaiellaceae bacterium]|nr:helix-turn-helix transcriptional regulator [Gaiellaceae bacterium]